MKTIIYIIFLGLMIQSCDNLEQLPKSSLSKEAIFQSIDGVELYSNSFYNILPDAEKIAYAAGGDEMSDFLARNSIPEYLREGGFSPRESSGWDWTDLRNINYFIENIEESSFSNEIRNNYIGIAKFFRAWFYFEKVKRFGDVPWISGVLDVNDDALYGNRDDRFVVMDSILIDIDYAINNITLKNDDSKSRISKNIAYALKSRICLFEGSFRKYHDNFGMQQSANHWFQNAASAAESIINDGDFNLDFGDDSYRNLFISNSINSPEILLAVPYSTELGLLHAANWWWTSATYGVRGNLSRTFINTYLNIDGTPFTDDPAYSSTSFELETKSRDLRLKQTIRTKDYGRINGGEFSLSPPLFSYTYTGYQPIKWVLDDTYYDGGRYNDNSVPIFRYAEILLNFAEAKAELGTLSDSEWDISIGELRKRAGLTYTGKPEKIDVYLQQEYFPNIQDPLLLEIRRERSIELVLEGFRFDDLRRWKRGDLLEKKWNGIYIKALNEYIDLNEDGINDVYFYSGELNESKIPGISYLDVSPSLGNGSINPFQLSEGDHGEISWQYNLPRKWDQKLYFYPIPESDLLINSNLKQNPGW